jgi:hypothetical protein
MVDYLLLMRSEGNPMQELSPEKMQAHLEKWSAWMGALAKAGRLRGGNPLASGAACVRQSAVTDGPYVEAKDVVGGFVIVACDSIAHAIETAKGCPIVELGGLIEVRETAPNVLG